MGEGDFSALHTCMKLLKNKFSKSSFKVFLLVSPCGFLFGTFPSVSLLEEEGRHRMETGKKLLLLLYTRVWLALRLPLRRIPYIYIHQGIQQAFCFFCFPLAFGSCRGRGQLCFYKGGTQLQHALKPVTEGNPEGV